MHPAPSLIVFSTLSGLGLGLLAFLGIGLAPTAGWTGFVFFALAFGLTGAGLLSSTLHLGHPERALKAFSQWRTSWLSREAWVAVAALGVMALYALLSLLGLRIAPLGWLGAALSLAVVFCTSMIYAQLRTVPRWHGPTTPLLFVGYAVTGGALLSGRVWLTALLLALMAAAQFLSWRRGDRALTEGGTTIGTATGLGARGRVRLFEAPHTGDNYLTKEMVFRVARKHAEKLRSLVLVFAFAVPVAALLLPFGHVSAGIAVISHVLGMLAQRWLFFAEAEHVVGLYYGKGANAA